MSKIDLSDNLMSAVIKMAEGNPGAISALMELAKHSPDIDPQSAFGPLAPILSLDTHGIYGSEIYILFSDKCGRDPRKTLCLLRAVQLGIMPESRLKYLASRQDMSANLEAAEFEKYDSEVCSQLDDFRKAA